MKDYGGSRCQRWLKAEWNSEIRKSLWFGRECKWFIKGFVIAGYTEQDKGRVIDGDGLISEHAHEIAVLVTYCYGCWRAETALCDLCSKLKERSSKKPQHGKHTKTLLQVWNSPILQTSHPREKIIQTEQQSGAMCWSEEKSICVHNCKVNTNPSWENTAAPIKLFNYVHGNKRCFLCFFTSSKQRTSCMICRASNITARLPEAETLASHGCNKNVCKRGLAFCVLN